MLAIEITLSIFTIIGFVFIAFCLGLMIRFNHVKSLKRKVLELEKEMLSNHAEILDLQRERASLVKQMKESKIPVIPISAVKDDGENGQEMPIRKKLVTNTKNS